jgi:hypothetical protein
MPIEEEESNNLSIRTPFIVELSNNNISINQANVSDY